MDKRTELAQKALGRSTYDTRTISLSYGQKKSFFRGALSNSIYQNGSGHFSIHRVHLAFSAFPPRQPAIIRSRRTRSARFAPFHSSSRMGNGKAKRKIRFRVEPVLLLPARRAVPHSRPGAQRGFLLFLEQTAVFC